MQGPQRGALGGLRRAEWGGEVGLERDGVYVHKWLTHTAVQQKLTQLIKQLYSNLKKNIKRSIAQFCLLVFLGPFHNFCYFSPV